jgi:DNA-binding transcriptional regulator YiaG
MASCRLSAFTPFARTEDTEARRLNEKRSRENSPSEPERLASPQIKWLKPKEIVALRHSYGVSQAVFARLLHVPKVTAISWEKAAENPPTPLCACATWRARNPASCNNPEVF